MQSPGFKSKNCPLACKCRWPRSTSTDHALVEIEDDYGEGTVLVGAEFEGLEIAI